MSVQDGLVIGLAALAAVLALLAFRARRAGQAGASVHADALEAEVKRLSLALAETTAAERAQAREEAHFRADFEWAAVGKVHYDPVTGRIIRANRAHAAMLGYEPEDLVGRLGSEFTYPEDRDGAPYRQLIAGQVEGYAREKRYLRRDGTPVWGRVSATVVRSPEGDQPFLAVAVIEDVDDRYKAQVALAEAKRDLEAVVEERTAALAQRDLLLREVYHRVKNNLQIVDSLLLMQSRRLADTDARVALDELRARVYAMGLVHHQLMGSKDLETFDIGPFLQDLIQHLLEGAGDGLGLTVSAAPLKVGLDFAIPLGLLVTELVTRSVKHAPQRGVGTIEVGLAETERGQLELRVTDGGSCADRDGASGLGATIVDGLVRQLKGVLSVSTDDRACVVVRMPAPGAV
jgi:PAS domain S-box-containing protein